MEPRRKIYIGSHGSIAMTLEKVVSENPVKNTARLINLYAIGTNEEIDRAEKEMPASYFSRCKSGTRLQMTASVFLLGGAFLQGPDNPQMAAAGIAAGLYVALDGAWRARERDDYSAFSHFSSGFIGSIRSGLSRIKGYYGKTHERKV